MAIAKEAAVINLDGSFRLCSQQKARFSRFGVVIVMYNRIQENIGYKFKDISLLEAALTHSSYANEANAKRESFPRGSRAVTTGRDGEPDTSFVIHNETLEFLGDAVLGFVIAEYLYKTNPMEGEGALSKKRAAVVCEKSLAECAGDLGIGKLMRLGKSIDTGKGRAKRSILSDALEALFAAVYLDAGLETARRVILSCLEGIIKSYVDKRTVRDYKTYLQELLHHKKAGTVEYVVIKESGPDHNKVFTSMAIVGGMPLGYGTGSTKKESEQNAAKQVIEVFESEHL